MSYRLAFLLGGLAFAVAGYFIGTVFYHAELRLYSLSTTDDLDILTEFANIFRFHLLTFVPWVLGTTGLAVILGVLYERQDLYRRRAEALAVTDSLTLLFNYRFLMHQLEVEISRAERPPSEQFTLLFLDIDDFKRYNDTHGHLAGDDVLRSVSMAVRSCVRQGDVVARCGGEEFVVLAPFIDTQGGAVLAERIRRRVESDTPVTVSIGVASYPHHGRTANDLLGVADTAMYAGKAAGKNRVCLAPDPPAGD